MFDPYKNNTPGLDEPANNVIGITASATEELLVGVKGLRVTNRNAAMQNITVITMTDEQVTLWYPPTSVTHEPLRIKRLAASSSADILVQGLTDAPTP